MTLNEAIKHAEEVAKKKESDLKVYEGINEDRPLFKEEENECRKCAEEHRQLAEWLIELKQLKEQQPCEDAISRQTAKEQMIKYGFSAPDMTVTEFVEDLPPVTLQLKTGHWILADEQNKEDVENDNYRFICSECQCSDIHAKGTRVPYCWKCGAKMEVEE